MKFMKKKLFLNYKKSDHLINEGNELYPKNKKQKKFNFQKQKNENA